MRVGQELQFSSRQEYFLTPSLLRHPAYACKSMQAKFYFAVVDDAMKILLYASIQLLCLLSDILAILLNFVEKKTFHFLSEARLQKS